MTLVGQSLAVAAKDLRIEVRGRYAFGSVLPSRGRSSSRSGSRSAPDARCSPRPRPGCSGWPCCSRRSCRRVARTSTRGRTARSRGCCSPRSTRRPCSSARASRSPCSCSRWSLPWCCWSRACSICRSPPHRSRSRRRSSLHDRPRCRGKPLRRARGGAAGARGGLPPPGPAARDTRAHRRRAGDRPRHRREGRRGGSWLGLLLAFDLVFVSVGTLVFGSCWRSDDERMVSSSNESPDGSRPLAASASLVGRRSSP